jgi:hypothetical protein
MVLFLQIPEQIMVVFNQAHATRFSKNVQIKTTITSLFPIWILVHQIDNYNEIKCYEIQ